MKHLKSVEEIVTQDSVYKDYEVEDILTQDRTTIKETLMEEVEKLWEHTGITTDPLVSKKDVKEIISKVFKV